MTEDSELSSDLQMALQRLDSEESNGESDVVDLKRSVSDSDLRESSPCLSSIPAERRRYPRIGSIPGIPVGTIFESRRACANARLHTQVFAGISGSKSKGAFSIVLSGRYEDDLDRGEFLTYTGTGGQLDSFSGKGATQSSDQTFLHVHNMALMVSSVNGQPVRVIRGCGGSSIFAPTKGYRYDGLYHVERAYMEKGKGGHSICRYDLRRIPGQPPLSIRYL